MVANTTIDENFLRTTTYTNVNGNYYMGAGGFYNKSVKIDSVKTLKMGLGININASKNINFSNAIKYASKNNSFSPNVFLSIEMERCDGNKNELQAIIQ